MTTQNTALGFAQFLLIAVLVSIYAQQSEADHKGLQLENDYSSPEAIFNSYRDAHRDQDFRRRFHSLTPSSQSDRLWGIIFSSGLLPDHRKPEAKQVMDKYIGDREKLRDEYYKRYRAKYGVDPGEPPKMQAEG